MSRASYLKIKRSETVFETVPPNNEASKKIKLARDVYKRGYFVKKYNGWNDEFDEKYDGYSTWYALIDNKNTHLSFCRVTFKNNDDSPLPIEDGQGAPKLNDENDAICEINNFLRGRPDDGQFLIGKVFEDLNSKNISNVYCIVDPKNKEAMALNCNIFKFESLEKYITYDGICTKSGERVEWQILIQTKEARAEAIKVINEIHKSKEQLSGK